MSDKLLYIPLFTGDTLKKFIEYPTLEERGAWISIVLALVENNGVLIDDEKIYNKCVIFNEKDKQMLKQTLSKCLKKTKKGYVCEDTKALIDKQKGIRDKRAAAGALGGKKSSRKSKQMLKQTPQQKVSNHSHSQNHSHSHSLNHIQKPDLEEKNNKKEIAIANDNLFEEFWIKYGKLGNREPARKAFMRVLKTGVTSENILTGLDRYQKQCIAQGTEQRFILHASTWLYKKGWKDEYQIHEQAKKKDPYEIDREALMKAVIYDRSGENKF